MAVIPMDDRAATAEAQRLQADRAGQIPWKLWGPYLSERQWGTVREDYSEDGDSWDYFTHDQARSRAYHWGEDGIAGWSDDKQRLCFALALWNGHDPILKERMFGLTNSEGNHGEDVKEYYFYLDATPTHSYMKYLYKYPQSAYPYLDLVETSRRRSKTEMEYELLDTGVFRDGRYFDVFVEYAKHAFDDMLIRVTVHNRGPEAASIHILPTLWFRNVWSWWPETPRPILQATGDAIEGRAILASHAQLGEYRLACEGDARLLFTENETNNTRLFGGQNATPYVKDGINEYVVNGNREAVNPDQSGTRSAAHYQRNIGSGECSVVRLRLTRAATGIVPRPFGAGFDQILDERRAEADAFYASITPQRVGADTANVMRQAIAGMLWSKQFYFFDADKWLGEHGADPLHLADRPIRNRSWFHMINDDVISMPDKWEYPRYAAWDLAFHAIALSAVDVDFAKRQLSLMLDRFYLHPTGQIPAYEWNFSDVNPPVHAWATIFLYRTELALGHAPDIEFLKRTFDKLLLNFNWWLNRKDRLGKSAFEGGFLGLDNIGVFDRSAPLPTGGFLEQADGTAWMALFCQNMLEIGVELATHDATLEELAAHIVNQFLLIARAMNGMGENGMWDEDDGFYYDLLRLPNGQSMRLKVRSVVGLLPLCATTVVEPWQRERVPNLLAYFMNELRRKPELLATMHATGPGHFGVAERGILALVNQDRLRRILTRVLDEREFLSPCGIRALSRYHADHPYTFSVDGQEYRVDYLPAESDTGMFGGNSNWRGPIWMPMNVLLIRALVQYYLYYGDTFKVECPTGSGRWMNLFDVSAEIARRLTSIFERDASGNRPVFGGNEIFQTDPHWRDNLLFYEYFHGDNGAGIGASHQTGWTGVIGRLIQLYGHLDSAALLQAGRAQAFT
jgi:Mannosylglycerate hydrolase MGH1-like glycoside hydrolase domain